MNPFQAYFDWHDSRYLAAALDERKNRSAIRLFYCLRVGLFLATFIGWVGLIALIVAIFWV
jgi:hypothetical protein